MTIFRPCIDLHDGKVKQIVGSSLSESKEFDGSSEAASNVVENHVADQPADWFARKYQSDELTGGHVIKLGPGNDHAAKSALSAFPGGLQIGGGIHLENATSWLDQGASHLIVTSLLFDSDGYFLLDRLVALEQLVGKSRIVVDLSCKQIDGEYRVVMNRWQTATSLQVDAITIAMLANHCDEFLVHAADVEGKCNGIDEELVALLSSIQSCPMTYAGGIANMDDVRLVQQISSGSIDVTVGSALDLFGGSMSYLELVAFSKHGQRKDPK